MPLPAAIHVLSHSERAGAIVPIPASPAQDPGSGSCCLQRCSLISSPPGAGQLHNVLHAVLLPGREGLPRRRPLRNVQAGPPNLSTSSARGHLDSARDAAGRLEARGIQLRSAAATPGFPGSHRFQVSFDEGPGWLVAGCSAADYLDPQVSRKRPVRGSGPATKRPLRLRFISCRAVGLLQETADSGYSDLHRQRQGFHRGWGAGGAGRRKPIVRGSPLIPKKDGAKSCATKEYRARRAHDHEPQQFPLIAHRHRSA